MKPVGHEHRKAQQAIERAFDRDMPRSDEAESALLGAMILYPSIVPEVIGVVTSPDDFYAPARASIYSALVRIHDRHQSGDLVQLATELRDDPSVKDQGGPAYLERIVDGTPGSAGAMHWARIVADKARLRRLIRAGGDVIYSAYHAASADEACDRAEAAVFAVTESAATESSKPLPSMLSEEIDRLEKHEGAGLLGLCTGFEDLDRMLSGLQASEFIIIAARPSMGKSALMMNVAENVALGGPFRRPRPEIAVPVGVFSMEMSKSAIAQRILAARSGVSTDKMRSGKLGVEGIRRLREAEAEMVAAQMHVDDTAGLTSLSLRSRARRMVSKHGIKCLFVDYLQLMTAPGRDESRQVEVSSISRDMKSLARELGIPVVCLSQLNRGPESRSDNRPKMSDLRESGSLEQDADVVMLLHREEYYHMGDESWSMENEEKKGEAEIIIAKQRSGPTGSVKLTWDAVACRFKNYQPPFLSQFGRREAV